MQKIVQISSAEYASKHGRVARLHALCDDGTVWVYDRAWKRIPAIQQAEPAAKKPA
jgi:hypothetical protein